ncbi:uncharacterized protein LOC113334422 isoform X1 [Papaver somniferum]|uniref:uncharacterized protein LOC113334422 isoform X1 n=1 Tax=Papaver somniferum TaxID=3469 RepID=UPI000E70164C|nr:uncharacterized protein LOC113334422 isoform X1 [Papaver somniferum]
MEYHWNPSLISSDQDEMFEEPDVENSIHFGAPAHAWRYYGATDWYQERTKISQSVVNCEFSVCCSRELSSIGSLVPPEDKEQGYNQLYMSDTELAHEALHRNNIFSNGGCRSLDFHIIGTTNFLQRICVTIGVYVLMAAATGAGILIRSKRSDCYRF